MKLSHKLEGFQEMGRLLNQLPKTVEGTILQKATTETLKEVTLADMKRAAPRHKGKRSKASQTYGTLLSNIRVRATKSKRKGQRGASISTGNSFWGIFLEYGTRYIAARPWFRTTFAAKRAAMIFTLGKKIGEGIEREAGKYYRGGR